ncbi:NUDIX domain-containing protein [Streptomyces sp. 8L]|uniref:NUDIX domain-containing protein n=1 Tax=Streptomyces sp. 8L TaxID=2877242 RepID=UPI001CD733BB|nr:NUDIX hydrolase [Streptomyces sp. 8L]MCA1219291.1 NUDIX hydrolase [Streptomyces sp. 8L]
MTETETTETFEPIRLTADVVVLTPDGYVLLVKRKWEPYADYWALPGGHANRGEATTAAAIRELEEETSVQVAAEDLRQLGAWDTPGRDPRGRYVTVAYSAVVAAGTRAVAMDDARDVRWWPLTGLPTRLAFDHEDILSAARGH